MEKNTRATLRRIVAIAMVLLAAVGCSKKPTLPETYPVRGKLVFPDGQPVPGGAVKFESQSDAAIVANGEIARDGNVHAKHL